MSQVYPITIVKTRRYKIEQLDEENYVTTLFGVDQMCSVSLKTAQRYLRYMRRGVAHIEKQPNVAQRFRARQREVIEAAKKPLKRSRHVGLELEFVARDEKSDIEHALLKAGLAKYVQLGTDGSVSSTERIDCDGSCYADSCECYYCSDGECISCRGTRDDCSLVECDCEGQGTDDFECNGHRCPGGHDCPGEHECNCECQCDDEVNGLELRACIPVHELETIVPRITKVINSFNVEVNKTCGFHVHLDMRGRDFKKAYKNLVQAQDLLFALQPKSRRENSYCKRNESVIPSRQGGRYYAINGEAYSEHRTVEVRLHAGTLNPTKIIKWTRLCLAIANAKQVDVTNMDKTAKSLRLSSSLLGYVRTRLLEFNKIARVSRVTFKSVLSGFARAA